MRPIGEIETLVWLTAEQTRKIHDAARKLPEEHRFAFVERLLKRLEMGGGYPSDEAVNTALKGDA